MRRLQKPARRYAWLKQALSHYSNTDGVEVCNRFTGDVGLHELLCSYFTIAGDVHPQAPSTVSPHLFADRVKAASGAGYHGMGLNIHDMRHVLRNNSITAVKSLLADYGMTRLELEPLRGWYLDGEERVQSDALRSEMLEIASGLGVSHIKVTGDYSGRDWSVDYLAEEFAFLCNQAREVGAMIAIELFPRSSFGSLSFARRVIEAAGRENGGIILDIWVIVRAGIDMDEVAVLPVGMVKHVEINDGRLSLSGDLFEDTLSHRLPPGEGEFPLGLFFDSLRRCGYSGCCGVEILSERFRKAPLEEAARISFDAAAKVLADASAGRSAERSVGQEVGINGLRGGET